jgi:hypothetical protein
MDVIGQNTDYSPKIKPLSPEQKALALEIINTPDSEFRKIARVEAYDEYRQSPSRNAESAVAKSIPVVGTLLTAAYTSGNFATKVGSGINTAKDWGGMLVIINLYNKAVKKLFEKSPKLRQFNEDHPVATNIGLSVGGATAAVGGMHYVNKLGKKLLDAVLKPETKEQIINNFNKAVNDNKVGKFFNERIIPNVEKFAKNHPKITAAGAWLVPAVVVGLVIKHFTDLAGANSKADKMYKQLKYEKQEITRMMANQMAIENDMMKADKTE